MNEERFPEAREVGGVSIDSRTLRPGDLFIAIKGPNFDGHDYIEAAVKAGAGAVVACRDDVPCGDVPLLLTHDALEALSRLAAAWRRQVNPKVVAITGSAGKTTVKEMVALCLGRQFRTHATRGNLNNHFGVPLTILAMPSDCEVLVLELGMSAPGEIAHLARLAEPDIGLITNILPAHLEAFDGLGGLDGIARAKGELLEHLPVTGLAITPHHDGYEALYHQLTPCTLRCISLHPMAGERHLPHAWVEPDGGVGDLSLARRVDRDVDLFGVPWRYQGEHMAFNALAAAEVAFAVGATQQSVVDGLAGYRPQSGRWQMLESTEGWTVIDDTYNANPGSMEAALRTLAAQAPEGHRVAVLGDMLELGVNSTDLHEALADVLVRCGVERLFTAGPQMKALHDAIPGTPGVTSHYRAQTSDWIGGIASHLKAGDVVLVKGSRGMKMEQIVKDLVG
ncbi:MAG: UDP-N-acetylmuramoyl-tripeptide--D-alanyl-D-alanine ligase [Magnetococcales bacterium]|nr:UDP-N-acetylmuramoyl-tripeptide--D-alanyl-D-alanine ligase [Magnetococcales bacterium]